MIEKLLCLTFTIFYFSNSSAQNICSTNSSNLWDSYWQSCTTKANPNPVRGNSHWVMYDLGKVYDLSSSWIWNVNENSELNTGAKKVIIDYSTNQSSWSSLGEFDIERGSGEVSYQGIKGPDFNKAKARYVILTVTENWGNGSCYGIAEVRFNLTEENEIKEANTIIPPTQYSIELNSDGNGLVSSNNVKTLYLKNETVNITAIGNADYEFSHWSGDATGTQNPLNITILKNMNITANFVQEALPNCQDSELNPTGLIPSSEYIAQSKISSSGTIMNGSDVTFRSGSDIELLNGFEVQTGALFNALIKGCNE
jgi:hypothetical protein